MLRAMGLERFHQAKLKPHLKMAEQRFGILNSKKTNLIKQQKREIAELLRSGKEEKARIRVEHLIRSDFTIEAYELLALLCELLYERTALIAHEKECPADMREAMCTLIWAARRTEVPELDEVAKQLELKYGKEFVEEARDDAKECVNTRVAHKLSVAPPSAFLVVKYLTAIAAEYSVDWTPADTGLDEQALASQAMPGPTGFSVNVAPGSNLTQAYDSPPPQQQPQQQQSQPPVAQVLSYDNNQPPIAPFAPPPHTAAPPGGVPPPVAAVSSAPPAKTHEPLDYHIPAAPGYGDATAPPPSSSPPPQDDTSFVVPPATTSSTDNGHENDDDNGEQQPPPMNGGGGGSDFDALAKRFESLKK